MAASLYFWLKFIFIVNTTPNITPPFKLKNLPNTLYNPLYKQRNFILIEEASSSSIKLYESSSILGLLADYREVPSLATDDWTYIERLLIREPLDA